MLPTTPLHPKNVEIKRTNQGFGFTLRHFIAYPPDLCPDNSNQRKAMETIFIKEVHSDSPADLAGLQMGDRLLMVNNSPIAGISYSSVVTMIKKTPLVLKLQVAPKECDVLQMFYADIAHIPESNRQQYPVKPFTTYNQLTQKAISMQSASPMNSINKMLTAQSERFSVPRTQTSSSEGLLLRQKSVLSRATRDDDFNERIRKSIEKKEEFLKSPHNAHASSFFSSVSQSSINSTVKVPLAAPPTNSSNIVVKCAQTFERDAVSNLSSNYKKSLLSPVPFVDTGVTNKLFERRHAYLKESEHFVLLSGSFPAEECPIYKSKLSNKTNFEKCVASAHKDQFEDYITKQSPISGEATKVHTTTEVSTIKTFQNKCTDVVRRSGQSIKSIVFDDNKPNRRISYLKATNKDYHLESNDFNTSAIEQAVSVEQKQSANIEVLPEVHGKLEEKRKEVLCSELEIKMTYMYGKRSSDFRSWRLAKVELDGNILRINACRNSKTDANVIEINIKNFNVVKDIKEEKKKFVFRLKIKSQLSETEASECSSSDKPFEYKEISFKTKSIDELDKWITWLDKACDLDIQLVSYCTQGKQLAEPQKTAALSSVSTCCTYYDENIQDLPFRCPTAKFEAESDSVSVQLSVFKSRSRPKPVSDKDLGSPKPKNWKDLLFRRTPDLFAPSINASRFIGSIGVPLKSCPMSKDNEFLPYIVDVCTKIVETRGLKVVGIYRIPGNKAAISELKEQVNKTDFSWDKIDADARWEDVNVVSSLLKLFIRSLPDALLPSSFYINFIEADKKSSAKRLKELKLLLKSLPVYSYETMKHIIRHLHRVSKYCNVNLMEPKNLAIIFGPSIIRTPNDTLEIAVKDMKHQCRIVELLVTQYEYFFENGPFPDVDNSVPRVQCSTMPDNINLLLDNASKLEHRLHDKESMASRFIPALRKRAHLKRSTVSSETQSGESVLSIDCQKLRNPPSEEVLNLEKSNRDSPEASDEGSTISGISDSSSMSLTIVTDIVNSKLRSLRSDDNQEISQTLFSSENLRYADESPDDLSIFKSINVNSSSSHDITKWNLNSRFTTVYHSCSGDSEVSTTSDPKDSLFRSAPLPERFKKRRNSKLFRSKSLNHHGNNSTRHNLTKEEKTDMNKMKRQSQIQQNRSIKRRHTVGGPHDYNTKVTIHIEM